MEMNPKIFKTYDVRGRYPEELNEEATERIAALLAESWRRGKIVLGYDARVSSPALYRAALAALRASGRSLLIVEGGMMTTPMLYFLVNRLRARGGIMVTASHSPREYNGLKAVGERAVPISGEEIKSLFDRAGRQRAPKAPL